MKLKITLTEITELKVHEETIDELKSELADDIKRRGLVVDPIIVEGKDGVVLDGTHRVAALKTLKAKFIPTCIVDYESPGIKVQTWFRGIKVTKNVNLNELPFEVEKVEVDEAFNLVNLGEKPAALIGCESGFIFKHRVKDVISTSWFVREVEEFFKLNGGRIYYLTPEEAREMIEEGILNFYLIYTPISKRDVVQAALTGKLFARKSTRHVIPARPLKVNAPLKILLKSSLKEANETFISMLNSRRLIDFGENKRINGRRYEEYVYVFE